ncbi:MAG: bifunctional folylpolyglutamate synthase/dihydrofolate synthase [Candidatus Nanopelagicaceae bacterium]
MINQEDLERLAAIESALLARWPETRIQPSLDRISLLCDALGSPQLSYPTIHIGGTNGKTSTTRFIDSLLFAHGLRTGRFTSPHLEDFRERICINGELIGAQELIFNYNDIAAYFDFVDSKSPHPISFFEAITALAMAAFAEHPVDVGIFEVGMGGQWDATNVIQPAVTVITPIGMDHMEYLGNSLEEIASTKAGILKPEAFAVLSNQEAPAAKVLLARAAELGIDIAREGIEYEVISRQIAVGGQLISIRGTKDVYSDLFLPLHGRHQAANAAAALVAAEAFFGDQPLDVEAVRSGFASASSPGRLEVIQRDPTVILDAAHNPHGARTLANAMQEEFTFGRVIGVVGVFADKDADGIFSEIKDVVDGVIVTQSSSPRALPADDLAKIATRHLGADRVFVEPQLRTAIAKALADANHPMEDQSVGVLITGSVITVGEARSILKELKRS